MLDPRRIRGITIDLDDTLWPIWPTIERAEKVLLQWLSAHAPMCAALFSNPQAVAEIRAEMAQRRPDLKHDMSTLRRESIRLALERAGEDCALAEHAFEAFFAERQKVELFADVLPALEILARRWPLVSLSNGNADVHRVGLGRFFRAAVSARDFGVGKPDPRIFHAAAGAVDLQPQDVLHIGDDVLLDVLGSRNAGMQAAWINRTDSAWPHDDVQPHVQCRTLSELCALLGC